MKEKKKKIFLIVTNGHIGGAQSHLGLLVGNLSARHEFVVCSGSMGSLAYDLAGTEVKFIVLECINSKTVLPAVTRIYKLIKEEKPDLIHTHSAIASFVGRIAGRLAGVKTLYTVHGWHFVPNSVWKRRIFGWLLELIARPFTTAWITVSGYDLSLGVKSGVIDSCRAWVIPNGVEDIGLGVKPHADDELRLVFVGRASFQKNCLEVIDILQECDSKVSLTMYVTSGDHLDSLKGRILQSGLSERVLLITDNPDASSLLHDYDVMLLTSRYEGMPLCVLEAMRAGLPVVVSDVCGMNEIVSHNETGYLYELGDIKQASEYVDRLINSELRERLGVKARENFIANHRDELMAQRTAEVYEALLRS